MRNSRYRKDVYNYSCRKENHFTLCKHSSTFTLHTKKTKLMLKKSTYEQMGDYITINYNIQLVQ